MSVLVEVVSSPLGRLAGSAAFWHAPAAMRGVDLETSADPADGRKQVHHLQVQEVEQAQLVLQSLPALDQGSFIGVRPVGHGDADDQPPVLEKPQETTDVALIASGSQEESGGKVVDGIGRDEDRPAAVV